MTTQQKIKSIQKTVSKIGSIDVSDELIFLSKDEKIVSLGTVDVDVKTKDDVDYWDYDELPDKIIDVLYGIVQMREEDYDAEEEKTFKRISD